MLLYRIMLLDRITIVLSTVFGVSFISGSHNTVAMHVYCWNAQNGLVCQKFQEPLTQAANSHKTRGTRFLGNDLGHDAKTMA